MLIIITICLYQKNIAVLEECITIHFSNIAVLRLFCYLMNLFFNCLQSVIIHILNVDSFDEGMGREIFFYYLKSRGSLCPDGTRDQ